MGIFGNPAEMRHGPGGQTAQEIVDGMQKSSAPDKADYSNPPHPSAAPKAPGPSIKPVSKGVYGAPIQAPIVK